MTAPAFAPLAPFTVDRRRKLFLGLDVESRGRFWSDESTSLAVIGPPRYGKTSGVLVPQLMYWDGPAVVVSTRADLLHATGNRRRAIADPEAGRVLVYDPTGSEPGVETLRWSPIAGCEDAEVAYRTVHAMTASLGVGISDGEHWTEGAGNILRPYVHAAALGKRSMTQLRAWLARQELEEPGVILREAGSEAAYWGESLRGLGLIGERERGSYFSVASRAFSATASPRVLRSAEASELDVDAFLASSSTLYIVGPSHHQAALAPMIVGLVDSIRQRAMEIAATQGGRLAVPLLLVLDEVANTAPLASLGSLVSEGAGWGILTVWTAQNLAQMRDRYGTDKTAAILGASTAKITYGGLSDGGDLANISSWAGELREANTTYHSGGEGSGPQIGASPTGTTAERQQMAREHSVGYQYRPALPPSVLQRTPKFHAYLWYASEPPRRIETRPALTLPEYRALSGYTPDRSAAPHEQQP